MYDHVRGVGTSNEKVGSILISGFGRQGSDGYSPTDTEGCIGFHIQVHLA